MSCYGGCQVVLVVAASEPSSKGTREALRANTLGQRSLDLAIADYVLVLMQRTCDLAATSALKGL